VETKKTTGEYLSEITQLRKVLQHIPKEIHEAPHVHLHKHPQHSSDVDQMILLWGKVLKLTNPHCKPMRIREKLVDLFLWLEAHEPQGVWDLIGWRWLETWSILSKYEDPESTRLTRQSYLPALRARKLIA